MRTRHQPSQSGELFRLDQRILRFTQVAQRRLGRILGLAHLGLDALALAMSSATVTIFSIPPAASRIGSLLTSHCRIWPDESLYSSS